MTKIISIVGGMQPSAPTIGTATAGDTTASVAFTPSTYIGKGTITYTATSSPGGFTGTASSSPITVSGLSNGTAYTFTVTGTTNYGVASVASASSNSITPATASSYELISTAQGNGSSPIITFTDLNLLTQYKHLQIRTVMQQNVTTDWRGVAMRFNSDSGTNYWWNELFNNNDTFGRNMSNQNFALCGNASGTQYRPGVSIMDIIDFSDNAKYKTVITNSANIRYSTPRFVGWSSTQWRNTAAITSISFTVNADNFTTDTLISLYGIKG